MTINIKIINNKMPFNLDIDLYFWMLDRGDMQDDQRNKVEIDKQRVKLHRDHS